MLDRVDGQVSIEYQSKILPFKLFSQQETNGEVVNSKEIDRFLNKVNNHRKVSIHHPWKQEGRAEAKKREFQSPTVGGAV
jgi:hypothetical protein